MSPHVIPKLLRTLTPSGRADRRRAQRLRPITTTDRVTGSDKQAWAATTSSVPTYSRQNVKEAVDDARDKARDRTEKTKAAKNQRNQGEHDLKQYTSPTKRFIRRIAQKSVLASVIHSQLKVDVRGKENYLRPRGAFVVVANHSSHLDAALIHGTMPWKRAGTVATAAAGDYFYSKTTVRLLTQLFFNTYPVDRSGSGRAAGLSSKLLDNDIPLLIYPEGTRSRDKTMGRFKPGAAALCVSRRVPCIPIALIGAADAMPVGKFWPKSGRPPVSVLVGRPIMPRRGERIREFNEPLAAHVATMLEARTNHVVVAADRAPAPHEAAPRPRSIRKEAS